MKNIFKVALLGGLLVASSNAKDLLNFATNGTANKSEVKILTDNEMKDAKGGYITSGIINIGNKAIHKINSSAVLNNNMIIRELRDNYKVQMENGLGGW